MVVEIKNVLKNTFKNFSTLRILGIYKAIFIFKTFSIYLKKKIREIDIYSSGVFILQNYKILGWSKD